MTISNVQEGHTSKRLHKTHGIRHAPDRVLNSISRSEIEYRSGCHRCHHHVVDLTAGPVRQKHRTGLSTKHEYELRTIVLLITASTFVFANQILVILFKRSDRHHSDLLVVAHN